MNQAHIHLLVNHLPIIGVIIGLLILIAGFILNNGTVKQTATAIFIFASLFAIPSFLTGEGAEEVIEKLPGVSKTYIETHEEIAEVFIWIIGSFGVLSLLTFLAAHFKSKFSKLLYLLTLIMAIVTIVFAKQVATTGGEIRHPEIRNTTAPIENQPGTNVTSNQDDD